MLWAYHIWFLLCWGRFPLCPFSIILNGCWNFLRDFFCIFWSYHMVSTFQFVYMVYHINWFAYIEEYWHHCDISHLIMVCYCCSVAQLFPTLCNPLNYSTPGLNVPHQLSEFAQVHVHWISDVIQPSHPLMPSSGLDLLQHQELFQWVISLHQMTKILEHQLQHQSFKWIFRVDLP